MQDLQVGRTVPQKDLDRLFPVWEKPVEPGTFHENSEEGALDAAVYFAEVVEWVSRTHDTSALDVVASDVCENCDDLYALFDPESDDGSLNYWKKMTLSAVGATRSPTDKRLIEVEIQFSETPSWEVGADNEVVAAWTDGEQTSSFYVVGFRESEWRAVALALEQSAWGQE